jgi:hypothetical protein
VIEAEDPDVTPYRFIVPIKGVNTFCTFLKGQLCPENPLPHVGNGEHAIDDEFGWVAWAADGGKVIGRTHLDAVEGEGGFTPLAMPEGYQAECLLFHRQVLFVGGNCGTEVIGAFDFAAPEPRWVPLAVPEQLRQHGKRIDDLLLDGDWLIAVDNVVFPKYLIRYSVSDPREPMLTDAREIVAHGTYEHIQSGAIGTDWLVLLSTSFGMRGGYSYLSLLGRADLSEYGCLHAPARDDFTRQYSGTDPATARTWNGVAFLGNVLLVAAGHDGVGVLDLAQVQWPFGPMAVDVVSFSRVRAPAHDRFEEECRKALHYVRPHGIEGSIVRVQPVPGSRHFLAVIETDDSLDTVVMELP